MSSVARVLLAIAGPLLAVACSSTKFTSTWVSLDVAPESYVGKKVAAVVLGQEEEKRGAAEDALARAITARGAEGVAGHLLLPASALKDKEAAKAKLREAGVAGVVVMRVKQKGQQSELAPSMSSDPRYASFSNSDWGPGADLEPHPSGVDTFLSIETRVYSLGQDKLLWGGVSKTFNPTDLDAFLGELADAVAAELEDEGLIRR